MVKYTAEKVTVRAPSKPVPFSKSPSMASVQFDTLSLNSNRGDPSTPSKYESMDPPRYETKYAYYSAGSGIPEVKVILGGFVIKGFLGIKTLIVKSIGMVTHIKFLHIKYFLQLTLLFEKDFLHICRFNLRKRRTLCSLGVFGRKYCL